MELKGEDMGLLVEPYGADVLRYRTPRAVRLLRFDCEQMA